MTPFGIALIVLGIASWTFFLALICLFAGFLGVLLGVRRLKPYLPMLIWGALSERRPELKNKSVLTLTLEVVRQSIYGMAGGRPKGSPEVGGKLGGIMAMIQQAQDLVAASKAPPQA